MQLLSDELTLDWVDGLDWALPRLLPPKGKRGLFPGQRCMCFIWSWRFSLFAYIFILLSR